MSPADVERKTFRLDCQRAVSNGIMETAATTFLLLIAVRYFHAGSMAKGWIAAASSIGFVGTPALVNLVTRMGVLPSRAAAALTAVAGLAYGAAAIVTELHVYVACAMVATALSSACVPLFTQIYRDNYPDSDRGKLFSRAVTIRVLVSAAFGWGAGRMLEADIGRARLVLAIFACASLFASAAIARYPARPITPDGAGHPFSALRFAIHDRQFGLMLISWMLVGFGNLMMFPLRVEYIANARYGIALPATAVALLTGVIPSIIRLSSSIWGNLFDRINFFLLRAVLDVIVLVSIGCYFIMPAPLGLIWGSILFGMNMAGGEISWSLWVTKLAPPDRVADYMAVHTFMTGARGLVGPLLAFQLAEHMPIPTLAWIAVGIAFLGTLAIIPEVRFAPARRHATPLGQGVAE
ncbi:MAG TPA: MFS transporter [Verrucomicrobiae bacterium]|nr:MFS transporter [Verrucomicrobiae bacterium]